VTLRNRLIRSATYEGCGDADGTPQPKLGDIYCKLARGGVGTIITGFCYASPDGRAMQPCQCGIHSDTMIEPWRCIVERVRRTDARVKLFMQLAHAGRQTLRSATGLPVMGASRRKCSYFRQGVTVLDDQGIRRIIADFADAAGRAQQAGFDGVQLHAAHGYLFHQFLSPWTNRRKDRWGDGCAFLEETVHAVRARCGDTFPLLVKLSAADDNTPGIRLEHTARTVKRLEALEIDAVEISYGTMEYAMNIFRGAVPVRAVFEVNPLFNRISPPLQRLWKAVFLKRYLGRFAPFEEDYNVASAAATRKETHLAVFPVGGIRSLENMVACVTTLGLDAVALCRPLICQPDLPMLLETGKTRRSRCTNCNLCAVHCDSGEPLRCYLQRDITQ